MRFTRLTAESFAEFGELLPANYSPGPALPLQETCLARTPQSQLLWQYPRPVVLRPFGSGALFVRSEAGFLRAFLFHQPVRLYPTTWFCVLPFKSELMYEICADSQRQTMQIDRPMNASVVQPRLELGRLVGVMLHTEEDTFVFTESRYTFWELVYLRSGSLDCVCGSSRFSLQQGEILLLAPGQKHCLTPNGPVRLLLCSFHMNLSGRSPLAHHPILPDRAVAVCLEGLCSEAENGHPYHEDMQLALLNGAMISLLRTRLFGEESAEAVNNFSQQTGKRQLLAACVDLIDQNISAKLTRRFLTEQLQVSAQTLLAAFREETGMGVAEYIVNRRLEHAKRMLLETDQPVSQISDMLGYCSVCYFSAEYKKKYGVSPSDQRRSVFGDGEGGSV